MIKFVEKELNLEHHYNFRENKHYLNDTNIVFHCHHYTTLYTQLALDANETELLFETAEESFYTLMMNYFEKHSVKTMNDKILLGTELYKALGLGVMKIEYMGEFDGEVILERSHIDSGWLMKWGEYNKPVNYIGAGFIAALFSVIFDKPIKSYKVTEIESIVKGSNHSLFRVVKK